MASGAAGRVPTGVGARVVTPDDDEWPPQLDDLRRISRETSHRVDRDMLPADCASGYVARRRWTTSAHAVGGRGRRAGVDARTATTSRLELGYGLAERGWCVVSGGAYGIDAQAHRGALTAGGCTIAVLACGIDRAYPMAHANLFERDRARTVCCSPSGRPAPTRTGTGSSIRNRVIAALTRGTVVVEASARSGARQTAGRARQLGPLD